MQHIIKKKKYKGYEIQSMKYKIDRRRMDRIIKILKQCKSDIKRPYAIHLTIGLTDEHTLNITELNESIRKEFKSSGIGIIFNFEHAELKGFHLHLYLIFDKNKNTPYGTYLKIVKCLSSLAGIRLKKDNKNLDEPSINYHEGIEYDYHNLKNEEQFKDLINRISYIAKIDNQENLTRKRKFGALAYEHQ